MKVEIVAIGNELLLGETVDTNSAHVARRLAEIGARVSRTTLVGDDHEELVSVLRETADRARWIITMGGLGPTSDDRTRWAVAEAFNRPVRIDEEVLAGIERRFDRHGWGPMPTTNRCQAEIPEGARVIDNPHGTAPGLVIEEDGATVFVLPGVPIEMRAMVESTVVPSLVAAMDGKQDVVRSRVVHTVGIGESALAEKVNDVVAMADPVEVAFLPHLGQVDIRLTSAGLASEEATRRFDELETAIRDRAGRWIYGTDDESLAAAILDALRAREWTVAVAESCTAGMIGAELTTVAGSSDVFLGGVMVYADRIKTELLGVGERVIEQRGAVSEEVCREMIDGVRDRLGADVGCAVTGIAGPGGGTGTKPVGLVYYGVGTPAEVEVKKAVFPGPRSGVRRRATLASLALLFKSVRDVGTEETWR